jgi:DNA-binding transcriptional regulator LsrR (DeoR family)
MRGEAARRFLEKQVKQREGAEILGVSERQFRRLARRARAEGDKDSQRPPPREGAENLRRQLALPVLPSPARDTAK